MASHEGPDEPEEWTTIKSTFNVIELLMNEEEVALKLDTIPSTELSQSMTLEEWHNQWSTQARNPWQLPGTLWERGRMNETLKKAHFLWWTIMSMHHLESKSDQAKANTRLVAYRYVSGWNNGQGLDECFANMIAMGTNWNPRRIECCNNMVSNDRRPCSNESLNPCAQDLKARGIIINDEPANGKVPMADSSIRTVKEWFTVVMTQPTFEERCQWVWYARHLNMNK